MPSGVAGLPHPVDILCTPAAMYLPAPLGSLHVQYGLYLLGHFDLPTRPDRFERALRVFFPHDSAGYVAQMGTGTPLLVHRGERPDMVDLGGNLRAQGFRTEIRELDVAA